MNAINVLFPYKFHGQWVFDDVTRNLDKEAFVFGADTLIDKICTVKQIDDPENGFKLFFSKNEFPKYDLCLEWVREGEGGNYYIVEALNGHEAWLCPALFKYFSTAPEKIYIKVENEDRLW
jgi:hypothetical protein